MAGITLKSLHLCLRLLENAPELKRRMPASANPKTLKEGLCEMGKVVGLDESVFKDPQHIAALIGAQRFVMIWGEPSVTDHVARVFDSSRVLFTVLVDSAHFGNAASGQRGSMTGTGLPEHDATPTLSATWSEPKVEPPAAREQSAAEPETPIDGLKPLLAGNTPLSCRLFRALFEHMLGFALQSGAQQGNVSMANDLIGSKEHGRSFLSTALFILGAEVDRENLMSFMMQQGLFGMPVFEHMLQNRDYCDAFHAFRRLERAFMGSPAAEEAQLRDRLDKFNAQFGGKPCGVKIFEADEQDRAKVDAYQAAADLLEVMALTPWCMSLNKAVSLSSSNSIRSVSIVARHFERFGKGEATRDQANREIGDHLLSFARQFSADTKPA